MEEMNFFGRENPYDSPAEEIYYFTRGHPKVYFSPKPMKRGR